MRRTLLLVALSFSLTIAGCGADQPGPRADTASDQVRAERIEQLEGRVEQLHEAARAKRRQRSSTNRREETSDGKAEADLTSFLGTLPGSVGVVIGEPAADAAKNFAQAGELRSGSAWSTIKVAIAERTIADMGGPRGLSATQSDRIRLALQISDNEAAASLFRDLEERHGGLAGASLAVEQMLRQGGDSRSIISTAGRDGFSPYGQTEWPLADQWAYMASLVSRQAEGDARATYLLDVMSAVGGSDTFGLGATGTPSQWKGGWGPGTDGRYLVRQMGVLRRPDENLVVAMAAIADDGSFESGAAILSEIAAWVEAHGAASRD